jgi:hypothetical protein
MPEAGVPFDPQDEEVRSFGMSITSARLHEAASQMKALFIRRAICQQYSLADFCLLR